MQSRLPAIHPFSKAPLSHVVPLLEVKVSSSSGQAGQDELHVLMPKASTGDLETALSSVFKNPSSHLNPQLAMAWLGELRQGVMLLHASELAHLDIKPDNLLLFRAQGKAVSSLKIADFDLVEDLMQYKAPGSGVGRMNGKLTLPYRAPQVVADQVDFGFAGNAAGVERFQTRSGSSVLRNADWWATLCVVFEILAATVSPWIAREQGFPKLNGTFVMLDRTMNRWVDPYELGVRSQAASTHFAARMTQLGDHLHRQIENLERAWGKAVHTFTAKDALLVGRAIEVLKSGFKRVIRECGRVKLALEAGKEPYFNLDEMAVDEAGMNAAWDRLEGAPESLEIPVDVDMVNTNEGSMKTSPEAESTRAGSVPTSTEDVSWDGSLVENRSASVETALEDSVLEKADRALRDFRAVDAEISCARGLPRSESNFLVTGLDRMNLAREGRVKTDRVTRRYDALLREAEDA